MDEEEKTGVQVDLPAVHIKVKAYPPQVITSSGGFFANAAATVLSAFESPLSTSFIQFPAPEDHEVAPQPNDSVGEVLLDLPDVAPAQAGGTKGDALPPLASVEPALPTSETTYTHLKTSEPRPRRASARKTETQAVGPLFKVALLAAIALTIFAFGSEALASSVWDHANPNQQRLIDSLDSAAKLCLGAAIGLISGKSIRS